MSRATARAMTMPVPPIKPWMKRKAMNNSIVGAKIQAKLLSINKAMPMKRGTLRPLSSLIGPAMTCPKAIPAMDAVIVSWTRDVDAPKISMISGSDGKYMSVERGAIAASAPKKIVSINVGPCDSSFVVIIE